MKHTQLLFFIALFAFCGGQSRAFATSDVQSQVAQGAQVALIDAKIKELTNARDDAAMNAYLAENKADMVMDSDWLAYKNAIKKQTEYQQQVKALDAQIAELKQQKAKLVAATKQPDSAQPRFSS